MATSGRSFLAAALTAFVLVGCSAPGQVGTSTTSAPTDGGTAASSAPTSPAPPTGTATSSTATGGTATVSPAPASTAPVSTAAPCRVDLPASWSAGLRSGVVQPRAGETLTVALGTSDGTAYVVSTVKGKHHTFEWRRGDQRGVVQDFGLDHPEWQVLGATWDGRYLAYRVDQSYSSFEDFSLYVWDSHGDRGPVKVAHGEPDRHGDLMQTPFVDPVLADGWLYWTQTRDHDPGHTVLSGYRLADGHTERLSKGYGRAPVRFGNDLVWADSDAPGQTSTLRMLDLTSHDRAPVPAALADVRGLYYLAGDADTLAWVAGAKGRQVFVWRSGWAAPRLLVDRAASPQFPRIAGDVVVFATDDDMEAADLRSWSSASVTPSYGGIYADGGPVATVGFAPTSKQGASVQALLDTGSAGPLGRSGC